jgi:DNA invertase Pin-like site-specific DNA recombinase
MDEKIQIVDGGANEMRCPPLPGMQDPKEQLATPWRQEASKATTMPWSGKARAMQVIGYASCVSSGAGTALELRRQTEVIARECKDRGLDLLEVVGERSSATGKGLDRPGLAYALDRIKSQEATGLVVVEISRLTQSVSELGSIVELLLRLNVRLVASADALDTGTDGGRLAARLLIDVSRWERNRISERTRHGLQAARLTGRSIGRPAVADDPSLSGRIVQMRAQGMTLQAIADQLNEDGIPTVRGGTKWRHSSVQAAAGYRRGQRPARNVLQGGRVPVGDRDVGIR